MTAISRRSVLALGGAGLLAGCAQQKSGPASTGTVTVGTAVDIINFDPYSQTTNSLLFLRTFNSWLLNYDDQLRPHPDVATRFAIAPDRRSVRLWLRDDIRFTTGRMLDSSDVLYALDRARDPDRGFNLVDASSIIEKAHAPGKHEVVIEFTQPTAESLITDLLVGQPILDKHKNNSDALASAPASAGPFQLVEWRQGERLVLAANEHWYRGRPHPKRVVFEIFTNTNAMLSALQSGSIDIAAYLPPKDAGRFQHGYHTISGYPGSATMLLRVNTTRPPYDNRTLRQAIQHCVNRDRITHEVLFGYGGSAMLPWGPKSPANDEHFYDQVRFDPTLAGRLLRKSGAPTSGDAVVDGSDAVNLLVMQLIQADLKSIGFDLHISKVDTATFQTRLAAGDYGIVLGQMGGGELSLPRIVQNSLFRLANNPLWKDGKPPQSYIDAMKTLSSNASAAEESAAYHQINSVTVQDAWAIGTYRVPTLFTFKGDLRGVQRDYQNALVLANAHF